MPLEHRERLEPRARLGDRTCGPIRIDRTRRSGGPQGPSRTRGSDRTARPHRRRWSAGTHGAAGTNGTGFAFRNAFDANASYAVNDVVNYNGSTYVAIATNAGPANPTPDTNPDDWSVMAQQGPRAGRCRRTARRDRKHGINRSDGNARSDRRGRSARARRSRGHQRDQLHLSQRVRSQRDLFHQ